MNQNTVINPLTGRTIRIGGDTYNRLIITAYDHINGELVRRETAPPPAPNIYYFNVSTHRSIMHGSRRYFELIRAGWEVEDGYYLIPPNALFRAEIEQDLAMVQEAGQQIMERRGIPQNPVNYEGLMAVHGETLANLNITLCRECFYPLKRTETEEGGYCNDCRP